MKSKYEISVWEDYLVPERGSTPEHYEERRIAIIGSNTMNDRSGAVEPKLVRNINGTNTFTFKIYYSYKKESVESLDVNGVRNYYYNNNNVQNPYIPLLFNERKIKVRRDNEWYDMIIKNCQEDSSSKSITYTCTDAYINELSKTGFNLEFNGDLENNQGTAKELAEKVLEGTDWQVLDGDIIRQYVEEPVYEFTVDKQNGIIATEMISGTEGVEIPYNALLLVFYSQVQAIMDMVESGTTSQTDNKYEIQFVYSPIYITDGSSQLVIDTVNYSKKTSWRYNSNSNSIEFFWNNGGVESEWCTLYYRDGVSPRYRASRLERKQECELDPLTEKYCYKYKAGTGGGTYDYEQLIEEGDIIYAYRSSEFQSPTTVNNLMVNSRDFTKTVGWLSGTESTPDPRFELYPAITPSSESLDDSKSYLNLRTASDGNGKYYNLGLRENSSNIPDGIAKNDVYVLRYKAMTDANGHPSGTYFTSRPFKIWIQTGIGASKTYFKTSSAVVTSDGWIEQEYKCIEAFTRSSTYGTNGIKICFDVSTTCWIEEIQFFKKVMGKNAQGQSVRINPGDLDTQAVSQVFYNFYNKTKSANIKNKEDIKYLYRGPENMIPTYTRTTDHDKDPSDWPAQVTSNPNIAPIYNNDFEKIRSITVEKSNRFNILQTIAETFECWVKFTVEHDENGNIVYLRGKPKKYVSFVENIGQETGLSFIYGIDLKTIQRTIQSDQIVTKTIVSQNSNEFAPYGSCTIARSEENYPRTNFILNFDYFINQGLLDGGQLNKDLYLTTSDSIGYYYHLNKLYTEYDALTDDLSYKKNELSQMKSWKNVYSAAIESTRGEIADIKSDLITMATASDWASAQSYIRTNSEADGIKGRLYSLKSLEADEAQYLENLKKIQGYEQSGQHINGAIDILENTINAEEQRQDEILNGKYEGGTLTEKGVKQYDEQFFNKYSRFIQEGSWISEDYMDDTLYYLDAQSVAYTSSRPQISYNISVLKLNALEEFKTKIFNLGDIASIQDTEFFGYTSVQTEQGTFKTPYKEKVLVSEVTYYFDEPEKDSFKVQNYKTQFEELFQRITAQTQTLQFTAGQYARAANAVTTEGTIKAETLQQSIQNNQNLVYSAKNELITSDTTGITVSDSLNPNYKTKITSGGVFITINGGSTWTNAINGEGVSTNKLTAGKISVGGIFIVDGNHNTFRWDKDGINAYWHDDQTSLLTKYVRFDQYGLYGVESDTFVPSSENAIWNSPDTKFGLTWKGFFLRSNSDQGKVEISTDNDIRVVQTIDGTDIPRIEIGRIATHIDGESITYDYGMRIYDSEGVVLEANDDGELWLKHELHVSTTGENAVKIGYLEATKSDQGPGANIHEVINANSEFIVYEDGSIIATSGTFSGTIEATEGHIGGYEITTEGLYSVAKDSNDNPYIKIESHEASGLTPAAATITAGNVTIDGVNSSIIGQLPNKDTPEFSITPELAIFNNALIRGKLSTVIFEKNTVQAAGGIMFFKTAYEVESVNTSTNVFTLKEEYLGAVGNFVYIINSNGNCVSMGQVTAMNEDEVTITPQSSISSTDVYSIVDLGANNDVVIGVNSTNTDIDPLKPQGLTVAEITASTENNLMTSDGNYLLTSDGKQLTTTEFTQGEFETKIFLGKLDTIGIDDLSGYGLYGSNVYLNGSLVTKSTDGNESYAGINTLTKAISGKFERAEGETDDDYRVIIWAGANSPSAEDIANAKFQVTKNGSIYAAQGIFEGIIKSADIQTARIHGGAEDGSLSFYNTTNGLRFYNTDYAPGTTQNEVFSIGQNGFISNGEQFISINNASVTFQGAAAMFGDIYTSGLHISGQKIFKRDSTDIFLELDDDEIKLRRSDDVMVSITDSQLSLIHSNTYVEDSLNLGNLMQYKPASGGYDLYVV